MSSHRQPSLLWPTSLFKRTDDQLDTPSYHTALAALPTGGTVLDVGVGAGWASLPLAPPAIRVIGVDPDPGMLAAFSRAADEKGVVHSEVDGSWPEVASRVECADVAVSHHVIYDVPELTPFLLALTDHARRRVVVELTAYHPAAWLNPLWQHFHGIERPMGPTADDVFAVAENIGLGPETRPGSGHRGRGASTDARSSSSFDDGSVSVPSETTKSTSCSAQSPPPGRSSPSGGRERAHDA